MKLAPQRRCVNGWVCGRCISLSVVSFCLPVPNKNEEHVGPLTLQQANAPTDQSRRLKESKSLKQIQPELSLLPSAASSFSSGSFPVAAAMPDSTFASERSA